MSLHTITWAQERRYGDPLLRFAMLSLAMDSGGEREMQCRLSRLAAETEIPAALLLGLLEELARDGHLLEFKIENPEYFTVLFPEDAFPPELPRVKQPPGCPKGLRRRSVLAFNCHCTYCGAGGDRVDGPDGSPWQIDRIVAGGPYQPDNITLACRPCNARKGNRPAPPRTRSLADVESAVDAA